MYSPIAARAIHIGHVWSDGQPVRYTNWSVGQPDSYNGLEACVEMDPDTGVWSDRDCNEYKNVICKKAKGESADVTVACGNSSTLIMIKC